MNYLDVLKTIYTKEKLQEVDDVGFCISLTKTLGKDSDNLPALKQVSQYLFYINPLHYFFLLYISIPRKSFIPKLPKIEKIEIEEDPLLKEVQSIFQWSNKETSYYLELMRDIFIPNKKEWEEELGIEKIKKEKVKSAKKSKLDF